MQNIALVLVCLAGASHGRRVQASMDSSRDPLQALAVLLQSFESPEAGFTPSGSGVRFSVDRPASARSRPAVLVAPGQLDRRSALLAGTAALSAAAIAGQPGAAVADVRGANQYMPKDKDGVNKFLKAQGYSEMDVPGGFSPVCNYIGFAPPANIDGFKSRERAFNQTLLVRFIYPFGWIPDTPSITDNGEAGNLAAGNYQKGDSVTFLARSLPEGKTLSTVGKGFLGKWLTSQITEDQYEGIKVSSIKVVTQPDGAETGTFDYFYTLDTRAGFTIDVKGLASVMSAGGAIVGIASQTTVGRWGDLESKFKQMASSFRVYEVKTPKFSLS